jgi:hypothetical protein
MRVFPEAGGIGVARGGGKRDTALAALAGKAESLVDRSSSSQ